MSCQLHFLKDMEIPVVRKQSDDMPNYKWHDERILVLFCEQLTFDLSNGHALPRLQT
jgi:hypothetical protein